MRRVFFRFVLFFFLLVTICDYYFLFILYGFESINGPLSKRNTLRFGKWGSRL